MARDMVQVRRGSGREPYKGPDARIGRSQFNRSHGLKTTFDASYLVPILVDEVLPGDTFTCKLNGFARIFSPLDSPVMDNIELETLFFFTPARLVWNVWRYFQGEHDAAGAQDTDYTVPICADGTTFDHDGGVGTEDLGAFFGIPDGLQTTAVPINALPFRCYNLIYSEWFRDQNLEARPTLNVDNGPDTMSAYVVRRSAKKHDYFTSSLPYLQKGDPEFLGGELFLETDAAEGVDVTVYHTPSGTYRELDTAGSGQADISASAGVAGNVLKVDLGGLEGLGVVGGVTINALRQSLAIQRLLEKDARGGTRYTEIIKAHFGVTSPDFRLQRPEYLGGGKSYINISPVANTSATATEDQGELRGVGTGVISGHGWAKSFVEHGYIIGLVRARADLTYFQGLDKLWSRSTRYDFYLPALANLGEQAVLNKEIWISNSAATDDAAFGYQQRWEEYRQKRSMITGVMNPDAASALSQWHLAEDFSSLPALNTTFIQDRTPMSRVTTVDTGADFLMDVWFDYRCARPIPVYSIPSITSGRF